MYERKCPNCNEVLLLKEYTANSPICKRCGIPLNLEAWTFAYTYISGIFFILVYILLGLVVSITMPNLEEFHIYTVTVLSFLALFWFLWRLIPFALSDLMINYKRTKEFGLEGKLNPLLRLSK